MSTESDYGIPVREIGSELVEKLSGLMAFVVTGIFLVPIGLLLVTSVKSRTEIFTNPLALPAEFQFENYANAWTTGGFGQYFLNSVIVVGISLVFILLLSSLAAYALVQFDFPADNFMLVFFLAGFMIPPQVLLVPLYTIMNALNLLNTYYSLIFAYIAFGLPFSVFLLRQFFVTIPDTYAEAARMDGCNELQVFFRVYLPLSMPALAAVAIYQFVFLWNEFLYAIIFITDDTLRTLPAGLMAFQGQYSGDWAQLAAGIVIAVTPTVIFFLLFQRQFMRGISMGTTKG
ncbi:putative fructose-amino acid permease [Halogeometricum pallidum JCM 14848]|uniref:Putative fructose-amino acid permease n=1 Tax=Halogeometricum pallidum JCM 14848 TaxID=1227487 RepID=M0DAX7_HALPD|nr:carbohydrate ABC transporter permease [Halogeometricum pallidum]ELZ32640.1 putative fructose-amino acid permease [Halogeometricum pallidum JCM 14848]